MPWKCLRLFFYLFIICKDFRLTSFIWLSYQKIFYATSKNFIKNDTFKIFIIAYCLNLFKDNMHKNTHKNMRLEPLEEVLWLLPHIYTVFRSCWHSRQLQLSVWYNGSVVKTKIWDFYNELIWWISYKEHGENSGSLPRSNIC